MAFTRRKQFDMHDLVNVITSLITEYENALKDDTILEPVLYALYWTWKNYDEGLKEDNK